MAELVTQAEAARRFKVSRQGFNRLVARGVVPLTNGKVDLEIARDIVQRRLDPGRSKVLQGMAGAAQTPHPSVPPPSTPPDALEGAPVSFHVARTLREKYNALEARVRYEQSCGRLVDAQRVRTLLTTAAAGLRLTLEALPDKLAPRLAAESDETACHALLEQGIDEALDALADIALAEESTLTESAA